jgi:hypothetical protein
MRAHLRLPLLYLLPALICLAPAAGAGRPPEAPAAAEILERFEVPRGGDGLLLPVTLRGKKYLFLLDTGSTLNVYDRSLPLGAPVDTGTVSGLAGDVNVRLYEAPDARVGKFRLRSAARVVGFDFAKVREVSGHPIYGVVGMEFLHQHVVRVDCDRSEVLFLKSAGPGCGEPVRLAADPLRMPVVTVDLGTWGPRPFLVDTGAVHGTGDLGADLFESLLREKRMTVVSRSFRETLSGTAPQRLGRLPSLRLGSYTLTDRVFGESRGSLLGMGFLARFVATFDFPHGTLYLKKGKGFDRPDRWNTSGLHLVRRGGKVVVHSVNKGSVAAAAGVRSGDVVVRAGDLDADHVSLFRLVGAYLTADGEAKVVRLRLRRGHDEHEVTLRLGRPRAGAPPPERLQAGSPGIPKH